MRYYTTLVFSPLWLAGALAIFFLGNGSATGANLWTQDPLRVDYDLSAYADGSGAQDSTAAIQNFLDSLDSNAHNYVHVPAGVYSVSDTIYLKSNTHLLCETAAYFRMKKSRTLFANKNADRDLYKDTTHTSPALQTDHDIEISGCILDFRYNLVWDNGRYPRNNMAGITFFLARHVLITNNYIAGDSTGVDRKRIPNGIRMIGVDDFIVNNNRCRGTYNCVGVWKGASNFSITKNIAYIPPNTFNPANPFSCMNINGVGTVGTDHETTRDFVISDNVCYVNGGVSPEMYTVAFNNGSLSAGSKMVNGVFNHNRIIASGSYNGCYVARGDIDNFSVTNSRFQGCDMFSLVLTGRAGAALTGANVLSTTAGSSKVSLLLPGVSASYAVPGKYFYLSGPNNKPVSVGGLSLLGLYTITAVADGKLTILADKPASSTQAGTGGSVIGRVFWGVYKNSKVSGNYFLDSNSSPGDGLIIVEGPGNTVSNNTVSGGTYGGLVLTSWKDLSAPKGAIVVKNKVFGNGPHDPNAPLSGTGIVYPTGGFAVEGDTTSAWELGYAPVTH